MKKSKFTQQLFFLFMRITLVQVVLMTLFASVTLAGTLKGQGILDRKVTLSVKKEELKAILKSLEKQAGVTFTYTPNVIRNKKKITLALNDARLEEVLSQLFSPSIKFTAVDEEEVVVLSVSQPNAMSEIMAEASTLVPIKGVLNDESGKPLAGVSIRIKGGEIIGMTNDKGEFALTGVEDGAILVFSALSIETFEIKLNGNSELTLIAKTKVSALDEVQIIAYGTTTGRLTTSSISKIRGEDIRKQPVENLMLALSGRLPGLQITQTSGIAGGAVSVTVRGKSSLGAGTEPLYIIDGVPFAQSLTSVLFSNGITAQTLGGLVSATTGTSPFVNLNSSDIESIEVLKDADATAIYGSRGANGVILITTRKAKASKLSVDVSFYSGWGRPTRMPEFLNTRQYVAMRKEAFKNDGILPTAANASDLMVWDTTRYINWAGFLMGETARSNDAQVRLSGGNQQTQFSLSTGFHRETPIFYGNMFDNRINIRASLGHHSIDNKFSLTLNTGYSVDNNNINTTDMGQLQTIIPNSPYPLDSSGNLVWSEKGIRFSNPLQYIKKLYKGVTENSISNINLGYRFSKSFEIRVDGGMNIIRLDQKTANPVNSQSPLGTTPISSAQFFNESQRNWIAEPQAEYTKQLGASRIQALVGGSFQEQLIEGTKITARGYTSDELLETPEPAASKTVTSNYVKYRYDALFARISYNYNDKYLLNISGRRDGSSRFGPGKQFGNFGAVGAAWIFSEEKFMRNIPFISYGKIRTSMGVTGNDRIGNYQYIASWSTSSAALPYQGVSGLYPMNLYNPDFAWERNRKWEAAVELGFLHDILVVSANFYLNRSDNQLIGYTLPTQVGFSNITANRNALLENRGWEFVINSANIRTKNFTWSSYFNITIPRSKLAAYPNLETSSYSSILVIDQPVTIRKYIKYQGVDAATGIYKHNGINLTTDRTQIRDLGQQLYGGLQNTLTYKGWSLDFFFHFVKQNGLSSINFVAPGGRSNQPIQVLNRWQNAGDITNVQKFSTTGVPTTQYSYYANYSSARVVDASFIRLRNVSLSYQFDKKLIQKLKAETLRVYLQGQNLLTFSPYENGDPETLSFSSAPLKMLSVGIQAKF